MSFEKALREMVRRELESQMAPLRKSVVHLERGLESLEVLRDVTGKLEPLLGRQGAMVALRQAQPQPQAPTRRGVAPARTKAPAAVAAPAAAPAPVPRPKAAAAPVPKPKAGATSARLCAVIGCKRPSRSKGYCSAHYQKLRLLVRTNRRPADWRDDAPPQSARDVKLPRGRSAAREREPEPVKAKESPKPKAWVRKKGAKGLVSLH